MGHIEKEVEQVLRITAVAGIKGGGTKSTTAQIMGTGLRMVAQTLGQVSDEQLPRPLLIDYDPQGTLSKFNNAYDQENLTLWHVQKKQAKIQDTIIRAALLDISPANDSLGLVEYPGAKYPEGVRALYRPLRESNLPYTHIIIDTPGNAVSIHLPQALTVADDVIIPVIPDAANFDVLDQTIDIIRSVKGDSNPNLRVAGLLISRATATTISNDYSDAIRQVSDYLNQEGIPCQVFGSTIREKNDVKKTQDDKTSIFDTALKSIQTQEYVAFLAEYLGIVDSVKAKEYLEYMAKTTK